MSQQTTEKKCENCNRPLIKRDNVWLCLDCNSKDIELSHIFTSEKDNEEYVFITCHGATLYEPGTNNVVAGVNFKDRHDPSKGYEIIDKPVYAPTHKKRRRIKKEHASRITRCQACQDYTVRMRRREGADFFIPSTKYPGRKKLKSVEHIAYEP